VQSNYIAGFLIVGFIVWIVMKGQLKDYRAVIGI
jgi:hypothetical protein